MHCVIRLLARKLMAWRRILGAGSPTSPRLWDKDFLFQRALSNSLREQAFALVGTNLLVLDVGSTYRPYYCFFRDKAQRFWTVDLYSPEPTLSIAGNAERLPIRSGSMDVCLCTQVLEHVAEPSAVISELARVLKPNGTLLLSTHGVFHYHPFPQDLWRWTHEGLKKLLCAHFTDVVVKPNGGTLLLLFHILGRGIIRASELHILLRPLKYTVYPLINVSGLLLDRWIAQYALSLNYLAVGRGKLPIEKAQ